VSSGAFFVTRAGKVERKKAEGGGGILNPKWQKGSENSRGDWASFAEIFE
jgi:hypothetical protein